MDQSREKAQLAAEQTSVTGETLSSIIDSIKHINDVSAHIARASEEHGGSG